MRTPVRAQIGQLGDAWHLTSFQGSFECWQKFCCLPTDSGELYVDESSCLIQVTQTQLVSPSRRPRPHVFAAGVASRPTLPPLPSTNCLLCGRHPRGRLQAGGAGVAQCACALQHEAAPLSCASRRVASSTRGFGPPPFLTRWRGPMAGRAGVRWPGQRRRRRRRGGGRHGTGAAVTARGRRWRRGGGGDGAGAAATARERRRRRAGRGAASAAAAASTVTTVRAITAVAMVRRHPGGSLGGGAFAGSLFPGGRRLIFREVLCARDGGACRPAAAPRHWRGTERGRGRQRLSPARRRDAAAGAAGARVPVSEVVGRGPCSCAGVCAAAFDGGGKGGTGGVRRLVAAAPAGKDPHVAGYAVQRDGAGALKTAGGAHAGGGKGVTRDGWGRK